MTINILLTQQMPCCGEIRNNLFKLILSIFYHVNFKHLLLNLSTFAILSYILLAEKGTSLLKILIILIIGSMSGNYLDCVLRSSYTKLCGLSGGIYGIMSYGLLKGIKMKKLEIIFPFIVIIAVNIIYSIINISNFAIVLHLTGLIMGGLIFYIERIE